MRGELSRRGAQCHNLTYSAWMPYSGTGSGRIRDKYRIRSAYAAGMTTNYFYDENDSACDSAEKIAFIKKYTEEYLKVRPYFKEDFYPLTEVSSQSDVWCAYQFHHSKGQDGVVEVFRRENAPYETAVFRLKGLDPNAEYRFVDLDGGAFFVSGKDLSENGFRVSMAERRKAKIYMYQTVSKQESFADDGQ